MLSLPYPVILASGSPRRFELLGRIVPSFEIKPPQVDEESLTSADPWGTALRLAEAKARAVWKDHPQAIVIGGDTVVAIRVGMQHHQLAKPLDEADARRMLRMLSGNVHSVITGVCIASPKGVDTFCETTDVAFRELSDREIVDYVRSGEPMDKAGAYAIQGGAAVFVKSITGSHSNVVGLPVEQLEQRLAAFADSA
jgi:septum formation protein